MSTRFIVIICFFFCTFHLSTASAKETKQSAIILTAGYAIAQNACLSPWVTLVADTGFDCSENKVTFRASYNYRFTPNWELEIGGGDLSDSSGTGTSAAVTGSPYAWKMTTGVMAIAGIGHFKIGNSFSLFGKIGAARIHFSEDIRWTSGGVKYYGVSLNNVLVSSFDRDALIYAAGFQYEFNQDYALRIQYENFGTFDVYSAYGLTSPEPINLSVISAGLVLSF